MTDVYSFWQTCTRTVLVLTLLPWTGISWTFAGDWPQILCPHRNGIADSETLAAKWPARGPAKVWEKSIGSGFAGVAVLGQFVILFDRPDANDRLIAFDRQTGEELWKTSFPSGFQPQIVEDDGPRAVPCINGNDVFAYSSEGNLHCVDLQTGEKKWTRKTHREFGANGGYFGAGSAPLVDGDRVIVNVGGDKQKAGIVAFDRVTGKTVWTAVNDQASYAAPLVTTIEGTRHLLCVTRLNFVSLNPDTGKEQFRTPFGQRGPTVNAAIPVVFGTHAFLTASYGIGAELVKISADDSDVVWQDPVLSSQYTTPILHNGVMYGVDGRQDGGPISLKCFDPITRKIFWSESGIGYSTLIAVGDHLLVMQTGGVLRLIQMKTDQYDELAKARILSGTTRALPAFANGRLYVRNDKQLLCVDLTEKSN